MANKINNKKDIMLLLLYSPSKTDSTNAPIIGRTRFVKMLYLFKKEAMKEFTRGTDINEKNFYEFYPWNFGPFSSEVYDDLSFFILQEFVSSSLTDTEVLEESEAEYSEWTLKNGIDSDEDIFNLYQDELFELTPKGERFTKTLYDTLSQSQKIHLKEFKQRTSNAPLRALLRYVYSNYRDDTTMSLIREQIMEI